MLNRIIIIGAGIAGLTTALLLKEKFKDQSLQITLYEQRNFIEPIGGGLGFWPNGSKILLNLPCGEQIKALAGNLRYEYWGNAKGETLKVIDKNFLLQVNGYPVINLCRSELQTLLLKTFGENNVVFGKKVVQLKQTDNNATVFFEDGSFDCADLIIGADGTFSTIRKLIFPETTLQYTGYIALVGMYLPQKKLKHHFIWGENRLCINFPISDGRHMMYTLRPAPQGYLKNNLTSREQQLQIFYGWSKEVDYILEKLKEILDEPEFARHYYCNETYDMKQPLTTLYKNRVVLIGDTNPIGSIMGLGTSKALEDANSLVLHLYKEKNIRLALENFSLERIQRIIPMINLEMENKEFFLNMTKQTYTEFQEFIKTSSLDDFYKSIFNVISRPSTLFIQQILNLKNIVSLNKINNETYSDKMTIEKTAQEHRLPDIYQLNKIDPSRFRPKL